MVRRGMTGRRERRPAGLPGDRSADSDRRLRRAPGERKRRAVQVQARCLHVQRPLQGQLLLRERGEELFFPRLFRHTTR